MKGIERFGDAEPISNDINIEGLTPGEVNIASAERLIERLEALGTLANGDRNEARVMIEELTKQVGFFEEEKLAVPTKLTSAIEELTRLLNDEQLSIRERINQPTQEDDAALAAKAARKELEDLANPQVL